MYCTDNNFPMSKTCDVCGRGALRGNARSHSNIAITRFQQLNLQSKRVFGVRKRVCVSCIKTMHRTKPAP